MLNTALVLFRLWIVVPLPYKKFLIGFAQISEVALEGSGLVQTHRNPPVASPLAKWVLRWDLESYVLRLATLLIQYPRFHVQYIRASVPAKKRDVTFIKHKAKVHSNINASMLVAEKNINVQPEKNAFTYVIPKTDMHSATLIK